MEKRYFAKIGSILKYMKIEPHLYSIWKTFNEDTPDAVVFPVYKEVRRRALKHQQTQLLRFREHHHGIWPMIEKEVGMTQSYLSKVTRGIAFLSTETWLKIESLSMNNPPSVVGEILRPFYVQHLKNAIHDNQEPLSSSTGHPSGIEDSVGRPSAILDRPHQHQVLMAYLSSQKPTSLRKTARALGISATHLVHVRDGKKPVSKRMYRKVVVLLNSLPESRRPSQPPLPLPQDKPSSPFVVSPKQKVAHSPLEALDVVGNCLNGTLYLNTPWGDITVRMDDVRIAPIKSSRD